MQRQLETTMGQPSFQYTPRLNKETEILASRSRQDFDDQARAAFLSEGKASSRSIKVEDRLNI